MIDEWFPLSSHVPLKNVAPSSLRLRVRYSVEKIMPVEVYNELKEVGYIHELIYKQGQHFTKISDWTVD